jgi:hypothetical protein
MSTFLVVLFLQALAIFPVACIVLTGAGATAAAIIAGIRFFMQSDDKLERFCIAGITLFTLAFIGSLAVVFAIEAGTYSGELFVKLMNAAANM